LGRWIATLFRRSRVHLDRVFEPMGLGKGLYLYLALLSRQEGLTQRQLAVELAFDEGTVARAVQKLTDAGWLRRERDPLDGRAYRVFLSSRAREKTPEIYRELESWNSLLVRGFSGEERELAVDLLVRMASNAEKSMNEEEGKNGNA
jgi:DNA-binding MarR family transcriptional regulator